MIDDNDMFAPVPEIRIKADLVEMMISSARQAISGGLNEDAADYCRAVLSLYPGHEIAKELLDLAVRNNS